MNKEVVLIVQTIIAALAAYASKKLGILYPVFILLLTMMIIDYISGMMASKRESIEEPNNIEKGWNSKKGTIGIIKKFAYIFIIGTSIGVDFIIFRITKVMGIHMQAETFFGLLTAVWFILNELLSILENAGRMGAPIPKFLESIISVLKTSVESKGSEISKSDLENNKGED